MHKTLAAFLDLLINQIFYQFCFINIFTYICKMSKDLSAKYYQDNKESERYQRLFNEEKEKKR